MPEWLQRQASSHSIQLATTAVASSIVVASTILGIQHWRRRTALRNLKASIPDVIDSDLHRVSKVLSMPCFDPKIMCSYLFSVMLCRALLFRKRTRGLRRWLEEPKLETMTKVCRVTSYRVQLC